MPGLVINFLEISKLIMHGPLSFLLKNDQNLSDALYKAIREVLPHTKKELKLWRQLDFVLDISSIDVQKRYHLMKGLLKAITSESNEIIYYGLWRGLEFVLDSLENRSMVEWIKLEYRRLVGNIDDDHDNDVLERDSKNLLLYYMENLGKLDRKKTQHLHLHSIIKRNPSLESWSRIFPFLLKPKSNIFAAVWQNEQDLPGMHLVYKSVYIVEASSFICNSSTISVLEAAKLILHIIKKADSAASEVYEIDKVLLDILLCTSQLIERQVAEAPLKEFHDTMIQIVKFVQKHCESDIPETYTKFLDKLA